MLGRRNRAISVVKFIFFSDPEHSQEELPKGRIPSWCMHLGLSCTYMEVKPDLKRDL